MYVRVRIITHHLKELKHFMARTPFTRPLAIAIAAGVAFGGVQVTAPPQAQAGPIADTIRSNVDSVLGGFTSQAQNVASAAINDALSKINIPGLNKDQISKTINGMVSGAISGASNDISKTLDNILAGNFGGLSGPGAAAIGAPILSNILSGLGKSGSGAVTESQLRDALKAAGIDSKVADPLIKAALGAINSGTSQGDLTKIIEGVLANNTPSTGGTTTAPNAGGAAATGSLDDLIRQITDAINKQNAGNTATTTAPKPSTTAPKPSTTAAPKPSTGNTGGNTGGTNVTTGGNVDAATVAAILQALGVNAATGDGMADTASSEAVKALSQLITGAKADLSNAETGLKAANDKVARLQEELARLQTAAAKQNAATGSTGGAGGPIMIQINQTQSGLTEAVKEATQASAKADEAQKNVTELQNTLGEALKEINAYKQASDEIKKQLADTNQKNDAAIAELTTKLGAADARLTEMLTKVTDQATKLAEQQKIIDEGGKAIQAVDQKVQATNETVAKQAEEIAKHGQSLEQNLKAIGDLRTDLSSTQANVLALQQSTKKLTDDLAKTQADLKKTTTDLAKTNQDLDATKKDLGETKTHLGETDAKLDEAVAALDAAVADLATTKQHLEDTMNELNETKADLVEAAGKNVEVVEFTEDGSIVLTRANGEVINVPAPAKKGLERCAGEVGEGILNLVPFVLNAGQAIAQTRVPGLDAQIIAAQKQLNVYNPDIAAFAGANPQLLGLGAAGLGILAVSLIPGTCGEASISQALRESFSQSRTTQVGADGKEVSVLKGMATNFTGLFKDIPMEAPKVPTIVAEATQLRPTPERVTIVTPTATAAAGATGTAVTPTKAAKPTTTKVATTTVAKPAATATATVAK